MFLRGIGTKTLLYGILKLHTLLGTFLRGIGTKTLLYDILKLHTLLGTFLLSVGTKTLLYDILKVQNRPKKPISVPECLSIYILETQATQL